jgi:hypothetical protein
MVEQDHQIQEHILEVPVVPVSFSSHILHKTPSNSTKYRYLNR